MKATLIVLMLFSSTYSSAQDFDVTGVNTQLLCLSPTKTTSLVFPFPVRHVDIGTGDILVQQVKDAENILLIKASRRNFPETNLSVVSSEGKVYSFRVQYDSLPAHWIFNVQDRHSPKNAGSNVVFGKNVLSASALSFYQKGVLFKDDNIRGSSDHAWGMDAKLDGLYIKENMLFFKLTCNNRSTVDYELDGVRLYVKDAVKMKRTASQEKELAILSPPITPDVIKANSKSTFVLAVQKFTLPTGKYVAVEISEKNGGRKLQLRINNRQLTKAGLLDL
ncbi:conjugative transposon protein TraN [Segetibacter sp. 3557_3]|uniref:conjugative transposon protein TraN n=1 Tax=Segetibacter sp. 3557_3 TaxID=2547429 RepID=UPI001058644F|nr:conjugative transposon protein TraN [Segetibacter sp. 3557_3]TDH18159.1 conjugative transposon protein TraN [Segetibacter sp. 3557_3]